MSDERDETRSFSPFDDATWADDAGRPGGRRPQRPGNDDDRTRVQPPDRDDRTRVQPPDRDDHTRVQPSVADDRTRVQPGVDDPTVAQPGARAADATSVMPPAAGEPAWSGRAEVRAPQPSRTTYQETVDWPAAPPAERDRWWMPILVGFIVLVLLAALAWGIYLIVQNAGKNNNAPAPAATTSAPAAPTTVATTTQTTQTTQPTTAPTTTTPTPTQSTTNPTDDAIAIPALRGLSVSDAKAALKDAGFTSTRVIFRPSDAEPDTVIDSDPEEGQEVPPDTTVTLVVSAPSTATATSTGNAGAGGN
jgi:hypothetical protein